MMWNRRVAIGAVLVVLIGLLVYGFWPEATRVSVETATRDPLRVTVEEEGQTRLRHRYVVSAPAMGYLKRVPGETGDWVSRDEVVARLATLPSRVQSASAYEAAEAKVRAAQAALRRAQAELTGTKASFQHAKEEQQQIRRLHEEGTASQQQLDQARVDFKQARAKYRAARQSVAQARGELEAARSQLGHETPTPDALPTRTSIRAPVDGRILEFHQKSGGVVQAGAPIVTVGNPDSLEVVVDVLSSDAVRMSKGIPVEIVRWGGSETLKGRVRRVAPQGETNVSALGVEEQRVEVTAGLRVPPSVQGRLGPGYRMVARFILWEDDDVLQVPQSALFRDDDQWAVFVVRNGRAHRVSVNVGHRSGLRAEITDGLTADVRVVIHPGNEISDGARVRPR